MTTYPPVLVIIVTWNKKNYVLDLLNSLAGLRYPGDMLDIVVVDNASTDGTVEALHRDFPQVQVIENSENLGGTGGFNTGLAHAFAQPDGKYEYLWLLDNDVQVHPRTLVELVDLLEAEEDVAIAGSTMMQLTTPWRINEMGAFVEPGRGTLLLNRHRQDVAALKGMPLAKLQRSDIDLSKSLEGCRSSMDVDYVAAASLVVRARVAREAGLWDDYFIHYDDVEWCLRIARMGHRILVSARSLIWHLPAEHKVPTWVLYYDNRNVLYMLAKHAGPASVKGTRRWIRKKTLYYTLLGKKDLARLHLEALEDFEAGVTGKKDIVLDDCYFSHAHVEEILAREEIKRVLIPWPVDLQACDLQRTFVKAMKMRSDLRVDCLVPPAYIKDAPRCQLPACGLLHVPKGRIRRMLAYLKIRNRYDIVLQSDYQPVPSLQFAAKKIIFVNFEGISQRRRPTIKDTVRFFLKLRGV